MNRFKTARTAVQILNTEFHYRRVKQMELKIEYVPRKTLVTYEKNAKIHTKEQIEQIKNSIQQFGFNDPIAVWKGNVIIEGHGRLIAAEELGIDKVPVIRLDSLTDEQRRAYMLAHNKLTMNTGFSFDELKEEIESFSIDMTDFGFNESELLELQIDDSDITGKYTDIPFVYNANERIEDEEEKEQQEEYKQEINRYAEKADNSELISKRVIIVYQTEEEERFIRALLRLDEEEPLNVVYNVQMLMRKFNDIAEK